MGASDRSLIQILNYLLHSLGKSYSITVVIGMVSQDMWQAYEKQGGDLNEVNAQREKCGLYKLNIKSNQKIVKKAWAKNVMKGNGCVIHIQKYALKFAENRDITVALELLAKKYPEIKVDKVNSGNYDTFYVGYKFKEAKEEEAKQEVVIQQEIKQEEIQQDNNEAAI